jgi:hypothetical protein
VGIRCVQVQGGEPAWLCVSGVMGDKREARRIDSCVVFLVYIF